MHADSRNFDKYLTMAGSDLRVRYLRVQATLSDLHRELAMVMGQERRNRVEAWIQAVAAGHSQTKADKLADRAAMEPNLEVWNIKAEIEANKAELDVIQNVMNWHILEGDV